MVARGSRPARRSSPRVADRRRPSTPTTPALDLVADVLARRQGLALYKRLVLRPADRAGRERRPGHAMGRRRPVRTIVVHGPTVALARGDPSPWSTRRSRTLQAAAPSDDELQRAQNRTEAGFLDRLERARLLQRQSRPARRFTDVVAGDPDYVRARTSRAIRAVTPSVRRDAAASASARARGDRASCPKGKTDAGVAGGDEVSAGSLIGLVVARSLLARHRLRRSRSLRTAQAAGR